MTTRLFGDMLNEYLTNRLMKEELLKRDWFLKNAQIDESWEGGAIPVPFRSQRASSVRFGGLTAAGDISDFKYTRGEIQTYKELYATMKFYWRDLKDHEGKIPEATFLKILPDQLEEHMDLVKEMVSINLLDGNAWAYAVGDGQAGGTMVVNRIDRFELDQKVILDDDNSAQVDLYVIGIDVNTNVVTFSDTRGGSAFDISAYTVAQNARFYHPGSWNGTANSGFTNIKSALLPASAGGDANIHGVVKTSSPYTQALAVSASGVAAADLLDFIFKTQTSFQSKARGGRMQNVVMSLQNLGVVMQLIQIEKGPYHVAPNTTKVSEYGWTEIVIGSPAGVFLKLVGIQELSNDALLFLDMRSFTFRTKGMFKRIKTPDGLEYFTVRDATEGYSFLVDNALFGELEVSKPSNNGIAYGLALSY